MLQVHSTKPREIQTTRLTLVGTLADKRKRRHGENTLSKKKNQFSLTQNTIYTIVKKKERHRKIDYLREHDFPAYPVSFPISLRFLTIFSHVCQVTLSPILQIMNSLSYTRDKLLSEK